MKRTLDTLWRSIERLNARIARGGALGRVTGRAKVRALQEIARLMERHS